VGLNGVGVGVGIGSGSGTGVAVELGEGLGEGVGVTVGVGVSWKLKSSDLEVVRADEFNRIPIVPHINTVNSAIAQIRFITAAPLFFRPCSYTTVPVGYTVLSAYNSRDSKQSRF
jgi:hypothetical protein